MKNKKILIPIVFVIILLLGALGYFFFLRSSPEEIPVEETPVEEEDTEFSFVDIEFFQYPESGMVEISLYNNYTFSVFSSQDRLEDISNFYIERFGELKLVEQEGLYLLENPLAEELTDMDDEEIEEFVSENMNEEGYFISSIEIVNVGLNREYLSGHVETIDDFNDDLTIILYTYYEKQQ